jgi:hypothetical protein
MGRIGFATENKGKVVDYDYPKLKLTNGEKARIIIGLEDPAMEYVHTLRKPVIANGEAVTEQVTNDRTGVTTTEFKKDFVGNPICLGDQSIIADKGLDPAHCPACKLAQDHPDYAEPPKRRFAMHVIRYRTKSGTFNVQNPFSVEILVWAFTDTVFNKIVDFMEEHGDLRKKDFLLGPCTNPTFQKFDITPGAEAIWLKNDEHKKIVAETFRENQIPDLTIAIGRSKQKAWVQQDVDGILEAWSQAKQSGNSAGSTSSLGEDLNELLDGGAKDADGWATPDAAEEAGVDISGLKADAQKAVAADGDDMFGDLLASSVGADDDSSEDSTDDSTEPVEEAPKAPAKKAPAKAAEKPAPGPDNFDDLLGGLNP